MAFINWDSSLDLHIDRIDQEHKILIDLMNKLYDQNRNHLPKETLKSTLSELSAYAAKHFKDEEKFMASIQYTDLESHKAIHQRLLTRINAYAQNFDESGANISEEFLMFLKLWVSAHIKGIDTKYANAS